MSMFKNTVSITMP